MKSNYKQLGELIERVDVRNSDNSVQNLLGVSIEKCFIKSVANVIGTDLSKYKVIEKDDFAVSLMQVSRDAKIPIACLKNYDKAIMSPAYSIFRVSNCNIILPDYLDLWFKRSEFDREAAFIAVGGVRGSMPWEDFCRIKVAVPPIEKQQEIVKAYKTVTDWIDLKKKINDNLTDALKSYFCHLYNEIPDESSKTMENICTLASSKRIFADDYVSEGIPFYRGKEITMKQAGEPITDPLYISKEYFDNLKSKYGAPQKGDILLTAVGTIGNSYLVRSEDFYFKDGNIIWLKGFKNSLNFYIYDFMQTEIFKRMLGGICIGSTQTALTIVSLSKLQIKIPAPDILAKYTLFSKTVRNQIEQNIEEIHHLHELQSVLLAKLSH